MQNIVSFIGLFCNRDLQFLRSLLIVATPGVYSVMGNYRYSVVEKYRCSVVENYRNTVVENYRNTVVESDGCSVVEKYR